MNWKREAALIEQSHNVERLPTAAPRQVKNNTSRAQRRAKQALRKQHASKFNYKHHQQREALEKARIIRALEPTPELLIVEEILHRQGREAIEVIRDSIAEKLDSGRGCQSAIEEAFVFLSAKIPTYGEKRDLERAFKELEAAQ